MDGPRTHARVSSSSPSSAAAAAAVGREGGEDGEEHRPHTILFTGGCGFIGSNVVNHFVGELGWGVINVDRLDYCSSEENVSEEVRASGRYTLVREDICNHDAMLALLRKHNVDTVVHFAAQSHVDRSFEDPLTFLRDNVEGTISLLRAARAWGKLSRFVHVSTDEVYGEQKDGQAVAEDAPFRPSNPYSASKAAAEAFVCAYRESFGVPAVVTRANNIYGPNQHWEKVVPKFILQTIFGNPRTIHGSGDQTRSFLHVSDAARAFELIVKRGRVGEIYNIGAEREVSIRELADAIARLMGKPSESVNDGDRPFNDARYLVDASKLKGELGWSETVSLDDGLRDTIDWFLRSFAKHSLPPPSS